MQIWHFGCDRQSVVVFAENNQLAQIVYWGPALPQAQDLSAVVAATEWDVTGGMLDENPALSLCPTSANSFPGHPALDMRNVQGDQLLPRFNFVSADQGTHHLTLVYRDDALGVTYRARLGVDPDTHILWAAAGLETQDPVVVNWFAAPVFPGPQAGDKIIDFSGRWIGEFQINQTDWSAGARLRDNRTGRTGHEHFPGAYLPCRGATNTQGSVYAFHYATSCGHKMVAEELPDGRRQIQFGNATGTERMAKTVFETGTLYASFSPSGYNGCAVAFQRHLRYKIVQFAEAERPRPVHYNSWESVYFTHDLTVLKDIAKRAADLGAERFVLDDGWFGTRDDDTQSLADWVIDARKYPDGLRPLIDHVHGLGMTFGIWFEPEMINENSDVYRAHPEWVLGPLDQIRGRQQLVLNMALPAVRDYLFDRIDTVLRDNAIEYIKWDHNRVLPYPDADQMRGAYDLLDRLRQAHPHVEIETCSSGGGRIDFEILKRTQRVWLSDSNDALERLRIQHNAALFLPAAVTGSHVGPRVCHTSGRAINMAFRAWVAAQRHMGFEMDPRELTEDEAQILRHVTTWWKDNRSWMMQADILRLDSDDPAVIAEQQMTQSGDRFVVFAGRAGASDQILPRPLRLTGLDPAAQYRIHLQNAAQAHHLSRGSQAIKSDDLTLSGAFLMAHGLSLPWAFPETMWVIEGHRI